MGHRGHNEGTIARRKDGRWTAAMSIPGEKRKWFYGKTKREAEARLREAQLAQQEGRLNVAPRQTLAQYLPAWLENAKPSLRPRTYDTYDLNVRRLLPHLGPIRLDVLRPAHVQQCYADLQAGGLSARSVEQAHLVLHRALHQAMLWDLVPRNVTEAVHVPRPAHQEMKTLTAEQLDRLFEVTVGDRWHALWVLLGTRGLRIGEAMGLKWTDVDFTGRSLMIQRALQRQRGAGLRFVDPKSTSSRRTVTLGELTCATLRERRAKQNEERLALGAEWVDHDLVFCTAFGGPMDPGRINASFACALEKAGLPHIRIHDLRHSVATIMLKQGEHPRVVHELLGHSTIALTLGTYSHVSPTMHREAAERMDRLFTYRQRRARVPEENVS